MIEIGRRGFMIGAGAACVVSPVAAQPLRAARLARPGPASWHIDTPPSATGSANGPNGAVAYRVYGRPGRIPVIALHGGPAAGETYLRPYAGLARDRQVVLYDQSGCGRSAAPADLSRYTPERYVAELEAVRVALGFERVALVGHSWGGMLAPLYAHAYPHRVAAMVLAGTAARWRDFADSADRWLAALGPDAVAAARRPPTDPAYGALVERYYARHLCRLDPWPDFLVRAGEATARNPVYAYLNGPSEFDFAGALASLDVTQALRGVRAPTLVTCGEYDEAPPTIGARIAALVPGARLRAYPGLSHMTHIEDPARVVGDAGAFLARHA